MMNAYEKQLFNFLTDYCTDEATAQVIISGGSLGYNYGIGGYEEVDRDMYDSDEDYREDIESQESNLIDDAGLPGSKKSTGWETFFSARLFYTTYGIRNL